jgi:hypothetical protein
MLMVADNNAQALLLARIAPGALQGVLKDLSVDFDIAGADDQVTVESDSAFFRGLYDATYLGPRMSEFALRLLLREDLAQGTVPVLPKGVRVASKCGERRFVGEAGDVLQLHESGIIYRPRRPFPIGVMTRGTDLAELVAVIRKVAAAVCAEVDRKPDA